jgi:hypothetical protein
MSGKIIQINPELFQISKKTKKNREEKQNVSIPKPIIRTSVLKNKLLNKIKEKKNQENSNKKMPKMNKNAYDNDDDDNDMNDLDNLDDYEDPQDYEDELSNAISYFDNISEKEKEKRKLLNKTYKNKPQTQNKLSLNNLQINIPHQLKEGFENKRVMADIITNNVLDDLPYGCLKGGTKPTYKTWMNTVKNYSSMANTDKIKDARPPTPPKKRQEDKDKENKEDKILFTDDEYKESLFTEEDNHKEQILKRQIDNKLKKIETEQDKLFNNFDENIQSTAGDNVSNKQYVKKITKKKYTLGKSSKYRKVGILVKGRQTKKNIINSHKKIKNADIHEIKKYLKKRGMLKTGSSCPDEILRKMYESSIMSGEINNTNKNVLIYNFLNDDEQIK